MPNMNPQFRTMKKDSTGWQHPGLKPMNLREEVVKELNDKIIPKYVKKALDGAMAASVKRLKKQKK